MEACWASLVEEVPCLVGAVDSEGVDILDVSLEEVGMPLVLVSVRTAVRPPVVVVFSAPVDVIVLAPAPDTAANSCECGLRPGERARRATSASGWSPARTCGGGKQ